MKTVYILLIASLANGCFAFKSWDRLLKNGLQPAEIAQLKCIIKELKKETSGKWCNDPKNPGQNLCNIGCLRGGTVINQNIECITEILRTEGLKAWGAVGSRCQNADKQYLKTISNRF